MSQWGRYSLSQWVSQWGRYSLTRFPRKMSQTVTSPLTQTVTSPLTHAH